MAVLAIMERENMGRTNQCANPATLRRSMTGNRRLNPWRDAARAT
jgi:hypothetical protein